MTAALLKDLDDPKRYAVEPEAEIFDEHEVKDKTGKIIRKVTKHDLQEYADECNQRDKEGCPCSMTIGHTVDDFRDDKGRIIRQTPETEQPGIVGYWRKFRVKYSAARKRWVLCCTPYVMREHLAEAKSYPKLSAEVWPTRKVIDPIAIMRITPDRPTQWTTHAMPRWAGQRPKDERPYRYSMESNAVDPTDPADAAADAPDEASLQQHMKCSAKLFPHLRGYHDKHMAPAMGVPSLANVPEPVRDPGDGATREGSDNTDGVGPERLPSGPMSAHSIAAQAEQNRVNASLRKEIEELKKYRMQAETKAAEAEKAVNEMARQTRHSARAAEFADLAERYHLDEAAELSEWGDAPADKYSAHIAAIKQNYRPNPARGPFINTTGPVNEKGNGEYTAEKHSLVQQYMRVHHAELQKIEDVEERHAKAKKAVMSGWRP